MRAYLDHNATTPLRAEARRAMEAAMDVVGNPSSVHAEGRQAKGLIETARRHVAALVGCKPNQVIFTSSATEAAALAVAQKHRHGGSLAAMATEHDCLAVWADDLIGGAYDQEGRMAAGWRRKVSSGFAAVSAANSETGIMPPDQRVVGSGDGVSVICDITQMAGKVPVRYGQETPAYAVLSAHKLGGPKGVGALINFTAEDPEPMLRGGGQEMNRRSGTENIIGICGFGAAAAAAQNDVESGAWARVEKLRNILELTLEAESKNTIFVGQSAARLPNTSCLLTAGWKGETQVMQMDLAGIAVSAGSACSSGKVKASKVLQAMGYSDVQAASAIRVSLGLETTRQEVERFAAQWLAAFAKHRQRAA